MAEADGICKRLDADLLSTVLSVVHKTGARQPASETQAEETAGEKQLEQMTPPTALAPTWRQILSYRSTLTNEVLQARLHTKGSAGASASHPAGIRMLLRTTATQAGFKECATLG